ncbi:MAG: hypothetical protein Q8O40_02705, partial [Chloroflexota bacterium]|nr:hypothetical protein [Chloroflexota bacterium]
VLPQDRLRLVQEERTLVEAGLHSRQRAMEALGVEDPQGEAERIQSEARVAGAAALAEQAAEDRR